MSINWQLYGPSTLAARVEKNDLPRFGFHGRKIVIAPGEAAVVIRDGRVEEVLTAGNCQVAGVLDRLSELVGRGADLQVVMVDILPFDLHVFFGRTSLGQQVTRIDATGAGELTQADAERDHHQRLSQEIRRAVDKSERPGWLRAVLGYSARAN